MERTITVKGRGRLSLKPDTAVISVNLYDVAPTYDDALEQSALRTRSLKNAVERSGIDPSELKTSHFNIEAEYRSVRDSDDNYRRVFEGYRYDVSMKVSIPSDNKTIGLLLGNLSSSKASPEFYLSFTVKDKEKAKDMLLEKAVEDSRTKAEILTGAAGAELGKILHIDYSWGEIEISTPRSKFVVMEVSAPAMDMEFNPEDLEMDDTVTIIWEIK